MTPQILNQLSPGVNVRSLVWDSGISATNLRFLGTVNNQAQFRIRTNSVFNNFANPGAGVVLFIPTNSIMSIGL